MQSIQALSDEELIATARNEPERAAACLDLLYERCYPRVAGWCFSICGDREAAADVAQEVFLRVHGKLDTFRGDSRFTTWLYSVTRRVAIDHGLAARRRESVLLDEERAPEPVDPELGAEAELNRGQILERLRDAMERDLEPLEARVVYLHYVDGLSLPAITRLLDCRNKSGAKAYLVGGMRKLRRRFGRWLEREMGQAGTG